MGEAMASSYGFGSEPSRRAVTDTTVIGAAIVVLVAAWAASWPGGIAAGVAVAGVVGAIDLDARRWMLVMLVLLGGLAGLRAEIGHGRLVAVSAGPVHDRVTVVGDPRPHDRATRAVVRHAGVRLEVWVRDPGRRELVDGWRHGDQVLVSGLIRPLRPDRAERLAWQHVVGELRLHEIHGVDPPSPVDRFSSVVRRAVERGSAELAAPHDALLRGFVIGDRRLPREVVERFRRTGLSHLMVASGLNVSLVIAAASPLLVRLRPVLRWMLTLALVAWFASLTRFEPSILRASVMAAIATTAFLLGRDRTPVRMLGLAVVVLVLVDPLLVRSLGFRLSVGATWGVAALGPPLARRLPGPPWFARPLGVTLGAQIGVAGPLLAGIGQVPVVSVPANLVAVPVAGLVKLYGLPASIVAGSVPPLAGVVMAPCRIGVWWVDQVALLADRVEPSPGWSLMWWGMLALGIGVVAVRPGR